MKQRSVTFSDRDLIKCYESNLTLHETAVMLNSTTVSVWRRAKRLRLFWKEMKNEGKSDKYDLEEILEWKHPYYQTFKLHKRLLRSGIKENRCEICGNTEWNNKPIPLHLDHIDGNSHNHRLSNLRMICPNCHAQTETYCGKNKS